MNAALAYICAFGLGGIGAILRTLVGGTIDQRKRTGFPLGTFCVNLSGAFAGGVILGAGVVDDAHLLVSTALVGAYTTYSTWMTDSERLARTGRAEIALANLFGSLALGFGVAFLGYWIGETLF